MTLRDEIADWLNAFKADPFSTGADKVDRLLEVLKQHDDVRVTGGVLLEQIDLLMPLFEDAIKKAWDRGDYVNAPRFGSALEAFRTALKPKKLNLGHSISTQGEE